MKDATRIRDQLLERIGGHAEAQVMVTTGVSELTRFANSFIHQNVGQELSEVVLTVASDGRTTTSTGTSTTDSGLADMVEQALELVRLSPVDPDWPGVAPPMAVPETTPFSSKTASAVPQDRADAVRAFLDQGKDLNGAGYCETEVRNLAFGSSAGQIAEGEATRIVFDGILRSDTSSGSAHHCSVDLGTLDAVALGQQAQRRARLGRDPVTVDPGRYEVVLGHDAMAELIVGVGIYGFSGRSFVDGQSSVEVGKPQFDPLVTIVDDALSTGSVNVGFDVEGTPKERWLLIDAGVSGGACHSRRTAHQLGERPNGYAPVGDIGRWYGGGPVDLVMLPGDDTLDELISQVERGIFVATFNYCRCLEPMTVEVTGLTRNGTFLIENGQITNGLTNMRFTQSFADALAPGNVLGLSSDNRYGMADTGAGYVRAPAARLASFNFTGNASG